MTALKLTAACASITFAACTTSVPEDVAYCVRTSDTSFEVRSALTPKTPTVLYTSEITRISPTEPTLSGEAATQKINENHGKVSAFGVPRTYPFTADIKNGTCEVGSVNADQYVLKPTMP